MGDLILGAGVTGLACAAASGAPALEAAKRPGGICRSYFVAPGRSGRLSSPPRGGAYRFELGGGHWIFGGDPATLAALERLTPTRRYERRSSVFFARTGRSAPYPLQYSLRALPPATVRAALADLDHLPAPGPTLKSWLRAQFGPTLCRAFFDPFHKRYTAGLYASVAPQDAYKSPVDHALVRRGAVDATPPAGYNAAFRYPVDGLDALADRLARGSRIECRKRVKAIDIGRRAVLLADGSRRRYDRLVSTLPLDITLRLAGLCVPDLPDPSTAVLVLNIGARAGARLPSDHWLYVPDARSGFHRVGFYSNVDPMFLPGGVADAGRRAAVYVERAFPAGPAPSPAARRAYEKSVVAELQGWGWLGDVEALDATWVACAYTWVRPGSMWREHALAALEAAGVRAIGRFARWRFQGIAESLCDGAAAGLELRGGRPLRTGDPA